MERDSKGRFQKGNKEGHRFGADAVECGRRGGHNAKRERDRERDMREWAELIGSLPTTVICPDGSTLPEGTLDADMIMQQYKAAHAGSTKAATFLAQLKGQMEQRVAVTGEGVNIIVENQEQADKLASIGELGV